MHCLKEMNDYGKLMPFGYFLRRIASWNLILFIFLFYLHKDCRLSLPSCRWDGLDKLEWQIKDKDWFIAVGMVTNSKGIKIYESQTGIISRKINNNWDASFHRVFVERLWPSFIYQLCMQRKFVNLLPQQHLCFEWLFLQQSYDQILDFTLLGVVPVLINVLVAGTN